MIRCCFKHLFLGLTAKKAKAIFILCNNYFDNKAWLYIMILKHMKQKSQCWACKVKPNVEYLSICTSFCYASSEIKGRKLQLSREKACCIKVLRKCILEYYTENQAFIKPCRNQVYATDLGKVL